MSQCEAILERITLRLDEICLGTDRWDIFRGRLVREFPELYRLLMDLYGSQYDVHLFLEGLVGDVWKALQERSEALFVSDITHDHDNRSPWFLSPSAVGAVGYVDLLAGSFRGLAGKVDYLRHLGVTYLHLMPIYSTPEGKNDGGYAVADYRSFQENLGTADDLSYLAEVLHNAGIRLSLDMVLNHTAETHPWARAAVDGDQYYWNFYYIFQDAGEVAAYQTHLRDIFPEVRKGSFTWLQSLNSWVWTTFNSYQWDLNYQNHEVFRAVVREFLYLANLGADIFRLDAVAFMWKEKGTRCESLPKVHTLIKALKKAVSLAVPHAVFKSEAIVHPDEVMQYIDPDECELSYNPLLMAASWEAVATRDPRLLRRSVSRRFNLPKGCAWVNYVRSHDDIGWTFDDEDADYLGINGYDHRRFLNEYYTGIFPESFAKGLPFQKNPVTGDCRISGTCASLAGLEAALDSGSSEMIELAIRRIILMYGIAASIGGIPLLYLGDELGTLNNYAFEHEPTHADDSRWVHRSRFNWDAAAGAGRSRSPEGEVFRRMRALFSIRKSEPAFTAGGMRIVDHDHRHILGYARTSPDYDVLVLANFSDTESVMEKAVICSGNTCPSFTDLLTGRGYSGDIAMRAWEILWLRPVLDPVSDQQVISSYERKH